MSYRRTGVYVAFHAGDTTDPTESDIRYYNMLQAWNKNKDVDFSFINSHEKTAAVRDSSKKSTLFDRLKERLRKSKNMVLIIGQTTRGDTDWVPAEIEYAVDTCEIPIIAAYPDFEYILAPEKLSYLWPDKLARIGSMTRQRE